MRRPRGPEDDASFQGMGKTIVAIREERGLARDDLAERIEERPDLLRKVEQGEVNADFATLRVIAKALEVPLHTLDELAEEAAPGPGGDEWRRWSREAEAGATTGSSRTPEDASRGA